MAFLPVLPSSGPVVYGIGSGVYGGGVYGGFNDSKCPLLEVLIDYQDDPTSGTFTWTDITGWVVSYSREPVRTNAMDQPSPATATITLRNDDSRFTRKNTTGPYSLPSTSGNTGLIQFRRVRVNASWNGTVYSRYFGYVTNWAESWDQAGKDKSVTVTLADNLSPLEVFDLAGYTTAAPLSSGTIMLDVLNRAGLLGPQLQIDTGLSNIPAVSPLPTGSYAAQFLKDVAATENGVLFADGAGIATFHDRSHRDSLPVSATLGDNSGEVPYIDPRPQSGDVWTEIQITPAGASTPQTASSGTARYFTRTLNWPVAGTYLVSSTTEAQNAANHFSSEFAAVEADSWIQSLTLVGTADTTQWPTILGLDTSDAIQVKRRPSGGLLFNYNQFVEGYGEQVQIGDDWRVTLALSPRTGLAGAY